MTRPPYLRWAAAVLVLVAGFAIELRPSETVDVPVAITDAAAGTTLTSSDVRWEPAPAHLFTPLDLPATLTRRVPAGSVVTQADVASPLGELAPAGWWRIELDVPGDPAVGDPVLAVITGDDGTYAVEGVLDSPEASDGYSGDGALVAFDPTDVIELAAAVQEHRVTVLVGR